MKSNRLNYIHNKNTYKWDQYAIPVSIEWSKKKGIYACVSVLISELEKGMVSVDLFERKLGNLGRIFSDLLLTCSDKNFKKFVEGFKYKRRKYAQSNKRTNARSR